MAENSIDSVECVQAALLFFSSKKPQPEGFKLAGNSGSLRLAQLNDLIKLRDLGSAGGSYHGAAAKLCEWVLQLRLLELPPGDMGTKFSFFEVAYFSDWDGFIEITQDLSIDVEADEFAAHKTDLDARWKLFTAVWEAQWEGLNSELENLPPPEASVVLVTKLAPSHPEGWGAGSLAALGKHQERQDRRWIARCGWRCVCVRARDCGWGG